MRAVWVVCAALMALLVAAPALGRPANPASVPISATEGVQFTGRVAVYTNAGKEDTVADDSATIAWGDGSTSGGTLRQLEPGDDRPVEVVGSHTYSRPGTYPVTVRIDDPNPAAAVETVGTAQVGPSPAGGSPVIAAPANVPVQGATRLRVAGPAAGTTYDWDLDGDGSYETPTGTRASVDHVFTVPGNRGVAVRASSGGTAKRTLHVNDRPRFFLALPKRGIKKGRSARLRAFPTADRAAPVAYYEWRFAGRGRTKAKKTLGPYAAAKGSVLTRSASVVHQFTKAKTKFTAIAHAKDGQQAAVTGFVKTGKGGYITAFEVAGTAAAGQPGATYVDVSTEPANKILNVNGICDPLGLGAKGECFSFVSDPTPHDVRSWSSPGGKCITGCGDDIAFFRYAKQGTYPVTMTIDRKVPKVTESVTAPVPVVASECGTIKVRGVAIEPQGCFLRIDAPGPTPTTYTTTSPIRVGGLLVQPLDGSAALAVVPTKGTVAVAPGGGQLEVKDSRATLSRSSGFTIPVGAGGGAMPAAFTELVAQKRPAINGLKAAGASARFTGGYAQVTYHLELPPPFRATTPYVLPAGAAAGAANADGFTVGPVSLEIAPNFTLGDVIFKYSPPKFQGDNSENTGYFGSGKLGVFNVSVDAQDNRPNNPRTGFSLTPGGAFRYGGATFGFKPGIALGSTGAFLESMTASINADPFTFTGDARITAASVFALNGCVAVVVAGDADVGKTAPFCKDEHGNNASYVAQQPGLAVRVHGQGSIIGIPIPGNAYAQWTPPNNVSVRGHVGYTLPIVIGSVTISGDLLADFQAADSWQAGMQTKIGQNIICLRVVGCPGLTVGALVSSKGFAGCGPVPIISVPIGAWVTTGGDAGFLPFGCETAFGKVRIARAGISRRLLEGGPSPGPFANAARTVGLRSGAPFALVQLTGASGAPAVTARGPGIGTVGEVARPRFRRSRPLVFRSPGSGSTFVYIPKPRRGSYSFDEVAGSTPIRKVTVSYGERAPKIRASVRRGRLRYSITGLGSHKVTFFEQARRFQAPLGRARGRRGSIRLTPNPGPGGRRRVVALIESGRGLPRARRTVASFRAPRQGRLRRPIVRARGRGGRLAVTWRRVAGARSYRVTITTGGRVVRRSTRGRRFTLDGFRPDQSARVSVQGIGADFRLGRAGSARVARRQRRAAPLALG